MGKVKILVEHEDGYRQELIGDTAICFTVSKTEEFLDGKTQSIDAQAAFIGNEIPGPVYARTISCLIASIVEESINGSAAAGFMLHRISQILEAKSRKIKAGLTEQEKDECLTDAWKRLFEAAFPR